MAALYAYDWWPQLLQDHYVFDAPKLPDSQHHARLDKHRKEVVGPDTYMMATDIIAKLTKLDTKLYTKLTHIPIQKEGRGALDPLLYLFYSGSC